MFYNRGVISGDCFNILLWWFISFVEISSSFLLFFISLCSDVIPFELGSGSSVSRETPNFPGFELRKSTRRAHYFYFPVVIRSWSFLSSNVFPSLEESLDISSRYVFMILVMVILRDKYSCLLFVLRCSRVVRSRWIRQGRPVILARLLTVFSLTFVKVSFILISRSHIRTQSWVNFIFHGWLDLFHEKICEFSVRLESWFS